LFIFLSFQHRTRQRISARSSLEYTRLQPIRARNLNHDTLWRRCDNEFVSRKFRLGYQAM
jgi:hypothetical protein